MISGLSTAVVVTDEIGGAVVVTDGMGGAVVVTDGMGAEVLSGTRSVVTGIAGTVSGAFVVVICVGADGNADTGSVLRSEAAEVIPDSPDTEESER